MERLSCKATKLSPLNQFKARLNQEQALPFHWPAQYQQKIAPKTQSRERKTRNYGKSSLGSLMRKLIPLLRRLSNKSKLEALS